MERLRTISITVVLTSLAWLGFGFWLWGGWPDVPPATGPGALFTVHGDAPPPVAPAKPSPTPAPAGRMLIPVAGVSADRLLDTFTQARAAGARRHDAIDIVAPRGTPVLAAGAGTVEKLFLSKDGGKTIYVRSPDRRTIHYYAHLDGYAPGLAEGQGVRAGQALGSVGYTGNAKPAASHLHFAILLIDPAAPWYAKTTAINPYPQLTAK